MDLEVVGRHALLFDDDAMAAFVNSGDALVEWNSLQIDRYDVRHLLSGPLPPRRRRNPQTSSLIADSSLNAELDHERYLDLPLPSDEPEAEEAEKPGDGVYHAVGFSYGNTDNSADQNNAEGVLDCPRFRPPFIVPESLLHSLPPSEKVHQIIARTATFVSKHGGQSEIVLRVKQGDNPTFGFLMPDHNLHAYYRFLVDHQEVLQSESDAKTVSVDANVVQKKLGAEGALSLLGSVYGSGEDEDAVMEDAQEFENVASGKSNSSSSIVSHVADKTELSTKAASKDELVAKYPLHSNYKSSTVKKNPSLATSKGGRTSGMKKEDVSGSCSAFAENSKEPLILEPPPDIKILVDKIVDFITKNGKQFEAALREQDSKQGRFPFLVPSNQYHPYYLKVLKKTEESKVGAKNTSGNIARLGPDKKGSSCREEAGSSSMYSDMPFESERKEKFKMIIGKSKKDLEDQPSKLAQHSHGISIDEEDAAAILQSAMRGFTNPYAGIMSSSSLNGSQQQGIEAKQGSEFSQKSSAPDTKGISKADASENASQPDSDLPLTEEQKLKAERRKRAKMFVAMLKSGVMPSKDERSRSLSVEPSEPGVSISLAEVNHETRGEGSNSAPIDCVISEKNENGEGKVLREETNEKRSRRKYRSRSGRHEDSDEEEKEQNNSEGCERQQDEDEKKNHKHSRKKHRSYDEDYRKEKSRRRPRKRHQSRYSDEDDDGEKGSDSSLHRHSRKRHSSSHRHKHEEDRKARKHSRKKHHRSHRSSHHSNKGSSRRSKGHSSGEEEGSHSSSGTEHGRRGRHADEEKGSVSERREELEEGEISPKVSDGSKSVGGGGGHGSREASVDIGSTNGRASSQPSETTHISDDLRAKVRAMLMTTL